MRQKAMGWALYVNSQLEFLIRPIEVGDSMPRCPKRYTWIDLFWNYKKMGKTIREITLNTGAYRDWLKNKTGGEDAGKL